MMAHNTVTELLVETRKLIGTVVQGLGLNSIVMKTEFGYKMLRLNSLTSQEVFSTYITYLVFIKLITIAWVFFLHDTLLIRDSQISELNST